MFITAICVLFLVKLRWPKNKSLYDAVFTQRCLPWRKILDNYTPSNELSLFVKASLRFHSCTWKKKKASSFIISDLYLTTVGKSSAEKMYTTSNEAVINSLPSIPSVTRPATHAKGKTVRDGQYLKVSHLNQKLARNVCSKLGHKFNWFSSISDEICVSMPCSKYKLRYKMHNIWFPFFL